MGRLAGFRYREIVRKLKALGFVFASGSWKPRDLVSGEYESVYNHPESSRGKPEGTLRAILKQAGIEPDTFLDA
jgi:predicted RNA binding protein YcfA (HicA-like mRNA interferase family)